jgi:hypothetical protein
MGIQTVSYLAKLMKEPAFTKPQLLLHHFDHLLNLTCTWMALHDLLPNSAQFSDMFLMSKCGLFLKWLSLLAASSYAFLQNLFGEGHLLMCSRFSNAKMWIVCRRGSGF